MNVADIDFSKVPKPSLGTFFRKENITSLFQLGTACYDKAHEPYLSHRKVYHSDHPIEDVWNSYVLPHPKLCWDSKMITFQFMFSIPDDKPLYRDGEFKKLAPGQIYFIDLEIIKGVLNIPVLHQIARVDDDEKVIQTCYMKTGKSEGSQWIRLKEKPGGGTEITHETLYKGTNLIRDRIFYPLFHLKAINQFHANARRELGRVV